MESKEVLSFTRNRQSFTTVDPAAEQLILLPRRKLPIKVLSNSHYIKRAQWKLDCYEVLLLSGETFLRKLYCFSTCYEDIRKSRDLVIFLKRKLQARDIRNTDIINYTFYLLQESNLKIPYTVCTPILPKLLFICCGGEIRRLQGENAMSDSKIQRSIRY